MNTDYGPHFIHSNSLGDGYQLFQAEKKFVELYGLASRMSLYGYFLRICEMSIKDGNSNRPFIHEDDIEALIESVATPSINGLSDFDIAWEIEKVRWVFFDSGLFARDKIKKTFLAKSIEFVL